MEFPGYFPRAFRPARGRGSFDRAVMVASEKTTPWASQDILGYLGLNFVDWDNPG